MRRSPEHRPEPADVGQAGVDPRWLSHVTQASPEVGVLQAYNTDPSRDPPTTNGQFSSGGLILGTFEPPWLCAVAVGHDVKLKGRACLGWSSIAQQVLLDIETFSQSKSSAQPQMTLSWCFAATPGCDFGHSQGSLLEGRMEKGKGILIPTCHKSLH